MTQTRFTPLLHIKRVTDTWYTVKGQGVLFCGEKKDEVLERAEAYYRQKFLERANQPRPLPLNDRQRVVAARHYMTHRDAAQC